VNKGAILPSTPFSPPSFHLSSHYFEPYSTAILTKKLTTCATDHPTSSSLLDLPFVSPSTLEIQPLLSCLYFNRRVTLQQITQIYSSLLHYPSNRSNALSRLGVILPTRDQFRGAHSLPRPLSDFDPVTTSLVTVWVSHRFFYEALFPRQIEFLRGS